MSWFALLFALSSPSGAVAPLEITITDASVIAVILECGGETQKAVVKNGLAEFPVAPKSACGVTFVRKSGFIGGPGQWTCTLDSCTQQDVHHLDTTNAPGRVNIIAEAGVEPSASLEITCPNGYRERASFLENTATFNGVPNESCTLMFKGGTPARYNALRWGTYYCSLTGTTAVCTQK